MKIQWHGDTLYYGGGRVGGWVGDTLEGHWSVNLHCFGKQHRSTGYTRAEAVKELESMFWAALAEDALCGGDRVPTVPKAIYDDMISGLPRPK